MATSDVVMPGYYMRITGICIMVSLLLLFSSTPLFAKEYSLDDLYSVALKRSEKIKLSEEELLISKLNRDRAFSVLIPTLSTFGNYTKYTEEKKSSTGSILQPDYNDSWGVRLEKSLSVSGREFTALGQAMDNIEKKRYDLLTVKEEYLAGVSEAFYSVLQAREAVQIADSNLERLQKYREAAQKRLDIGEATKTALLRAQGEVSGALSDQIQANNKLAITRIVLARIVGIDSDFNLNEPESMESEVASLPQLQEIAKKNRYELKSLKSQLKMAEKQIEYSRGALWPTATFITTYSRLTQEPRSTSGYNDEAISAGISLNFPFYDGGLRKVDIREAEAQKRQIDLIYDDQEKIIEVEVENSWLYVSAQKSVIKYLEDQLIFATNNYYAVSKQFEFGLSDSIDIIDANNLLLTSQLKLSDAKYNYQLSLLKLKRAIGALLKEVEKSS